MVLVHSSEEHHISMMTSSNGNIFRVTGHLCGNSPVPGEFPAQRPVTQSFDVFFDLRLNKRLRKQSWGWWFETLSRPWWRHCHAGIKGPNESHWHMCIVLYQLIGWHDFVYNIVVMCTIEYHDSQCRTFWSNHGRFRLHNFYPLSISLFHNLSQIRLG